MLRRRAIVTAYRPRPPLHRPALAITITVALLLSGLMWYRYSPCLDLIVWSSREKYELLVRLAKQYPAPRVERRCFDIIIEQVDSGAAEELLRDWTDQKSGRPHVWSPAASTWLQILEAHRQEAGRPQIVPAVAQSIIQSPLVLAMLEPMEALLRATRPSIGWDDIAELAHDPQGWNRYGQPWGPFKLIKTTPLNSTSGLHAVITLDNFAQSVDDPLAFLEDIESAVVHYPDSVRAFLESLYRADLKGNALTMMSAIAVEEKQVFDYNRGCAIDPCGSAPTHKLKPIYPNSPTLRADHPYAVLDWSDYPDKALYLQAAASFQRYLEGDAQKSMQEEGFRDHRGQAGADLTGRGVDPAEPRVGYLAPRVGAILNALDSWQDSLRKRANAMVLLDVAKSMDQQVGNGKTRLDIVRESFDDPLRRLARDDVFALGTLPPQAGQPYRPVLGPTPLGAHPSQLWERIKGLQTEAGPPTLYSGIKAAADSVRATYARDHVNAVIVVTDGTNDGLGAHFNLMLSLRQQPTDHRVLIFVVALSKIAADQLREITDESGGLYYDASDPTTIPRWIRSALQNL